MALLYDNSRKKIAYMDFDGVLVKSNSVNYLIQTHIHFLSKPRLVLWCLLILLKAPLFILLNKFSADKFDRYLYRHFKGVKVKDLQQAVQGRVNDHLFSRFLPEAELEIKKLKQQGYRIVVVSAALGDIIEPFAREIGADTCLATELEIEDGYYTGRIKGVSTNYKNKKKAIQHYQDYNNIRPGWTVAYGNSQWDIPMLEFADQAIPVNAEKKLAAWADRSMVKVSHWQLEKIPLRFHVLYLLLKPFISTHRDLSFIPRSGGVIIIANHCSYLDHYLIGLTVMCCYRRRVRFLAKKEHFEKPLDKWIHQWLGAFPIDRDGTSKDSLLNVIRLLDNNEIVLIYPEGTRSSDGTLQEFKPGVLFTHYRSGCPIVPAGIKGAHEVLPKGKVIPRRARMSLQFGPPVNFSGSKMARGNERKHQLHRLQEQVRTLMQ